MKFAFRTDASQEIGSGHVMRCLALADGLRERGLESIFICRSHVGNLLDLINRRGYKVLKLPTFSDKPNPTNSIPSHASWLGTDWLTDANDTKCALGHSMPDWLVVDHYALDQRWEKLLHSSCRHIMVIDDLANRSHDCDLLLDQNLGRLPEDYSGLLPKNAHLLIGARFSLLRPEFAQLRHRSLARRQSLKFRRLLITMGGVDKNNATGRVLQALEKCDLPEDLQIDVVMGHNALWLPKVNAQAVMMSRKTRVLVGVQDMASIMAESDFAISSAGSTMWEVCCLGLPSINIVLADNQTLIANALNKIGASVKVSLQSLERFLEAAFSDRDFVGSLLFQSRIAAEVTDGMGVMRVSDFLINPNF